jgi:hypothetical protein
METAKGLSVGLPGFMTKPLNALIDQAKAQKMINDNEVCGLFLFIASDWVPGQGWIGEIVYQAVPNLAMDGSGGFEMDPVASAMFMSEAVDKRDAVAKAVCARYGWDEKTPWSEAVKMDILEQIEGMRKDGIVVDDARAEDHIALGLYEEMMDVSSGFNPFAVKQGYISIPPEGDDDGVSRMSVHTWLMCRGVTVLCGIGHSHPSGVAALSPEDFLATKTVEQWRKTFQVRYATEGQKTGSMLELPRSVGNWIYALPEVDSMFGFSSEDPSEPVRSALEATSTVLRYDGRGVKGTWTGPF